MADIQKRASAGGVRWDVRYRDDRAGTAHSERSRAASGDSCLGSRPIDGIAVELQAHGRTADIDRPLSYSSMADGAVAVMQALEIDRADVVGYSVGGGVALDMAIRHPESVRRIVVTGGAAYRPDGMYPELVTAFDAGPAGLDDTGWHHAYLAVAPDPAGWPKLVAKVNDLDRTFIGWDEADIMAVTAPAMLIIGDSDIVRPEHTIALFRLLGGGVHGDLVGLPQSRLAVLPGTTHQSILDRLDWLESMIIDFLDHDSAP